MFRALILALLFSVPASASERRFDPLATHLSHFVDAFELGTLSAKSRDRIHHIMNHRGSTHAEKVFALVDLLDREGALRHVDIHGPRSYRMASSD